MEEQEFINALRGVVLELTGKADIALVRRFAELLNEEFGWAEMSRIRKIRLVRVFAAAHGWGNLDLRSCMEAVDGTPFSKNPVFRK